MTVHSLLPIGLTSKFSRPVGSAGTATQVQSDSILLQDWGGFARNTSKKPTIQTATETSVDQAPPCSSLSWAEQLKGVFDIDISVCPLRGGILRVIADVTDPDAIQTILAHLKQHAPPDAVHRQRPGPGPQNDLFAAI
jgi:hypothetical protein